MRRINLDDDFEDAYEDFDDDDYEDFEDVDDDDDDDDDDYRANPESALASLMKLASEAMTASGMYGSTIDVDFYTSEPKIKEWAALASAEQLAPGVWFARYYAVFRYSRALWGKQTPAKRQAEVRGAFLTVAKLYLTEEQRAKASKPRKAPRAATKAATNKQLKEGEIDHEIVARFRRESAESVSDMKAAPRRSKSADTLAELIGKVRALLRKHEAAKHFIEGGKGFSAFIYVTFDIGGKQKRVLAGSAPCFANTPALQRDMKKIPGLISYDAVAD